MHRIASYLVIAIVGLILECTLETAIAQSLVGAQRLPPLAGSFGEPLAAEGFTPLRRPVAPASPPTAYSHGDPTAPEQLMLELVNRARAHPAAEALRFELDLNENLEPGTITPAPKPPLAFHPQLIASARAHSDWMLAADVFSHTGLDGSTPGDRMEAAGYVFRGNWAWGENLAWQGTTGTPDPTAYTVDEHEGLFRSPPHRLNLLKDDFDEVGIGVRSGVFTQNDTDYNAVAATQNFARSASTPGPLILGVVFHDANGDKFYSAGEGLMGLTVAPSSGGPYAVTSASGGFAFPANRTSGTMTVTVSGPGLPNSMAKTINLAATNVKVDFDTANDVPLSFVPGSMGFDAQGHFRFELTGPTGARAQVSFATELVSWELLGVWTLAGGRVTVTDPAPKQARRFYQARTLP